jgi:Leucine-rich repeat (LRR) protein
MKNLQVLSVAKNRITAIPDTIGYLSSLSELDLSFNEITELTSCISYLDKLKTLSLAFNQISHLPTDISGLVNLITIDLTRNPLRVLPAEISKLPFLRRMRVDDCPFENNICYPLKHNAPSLVEICARTAVRHQINIDEDSILPSHMVTYIKSAKPCTSCHGPYYESYVLRGRLMEKTDMQIPLEYTLCSAHWSDANDRILSMFSAQPETSSCVKHLPYRPSLPSVPHKPAEKITALSRHSCTPSSPLIDSNVTTDMTITEDVQQLASTTKSNKKNRKSALSKLSFRLKKPSNFSW